MRSFPITEKDFLQQVKDLALLCGWRSYHTWGSFHSPSGFPDLVLVRSDRLIFAELKSDKGKVSPDQTAWQEALAGTGNDVYLWRPSEWDSIVEVLK